VIRVRCGAVLAAITASTSAAQVAAARDPRLSLDELPVVTLEPDLEQLLASAMTAPDSNTALATPGLEPGLAERLQHKLAETAQRQETAGKPAVLLVPPQLRSAMSRFLRSAVPSLHVLAWNEVPDSRKVRLVGTVGRY